ncbi:MAG: polysaccharide deacetylase family protein [Gemmatimonadetes bacterium]|nr:polysaccharide deacetylase family protein [Gemmatimonadota bacterium]
MNPAKLALARLFEITGLNALSHGVQRALYAPFIRAINYHDVPPSQSELFERQLRYYADHFAPVTYAGLQQLIRGEWSAAKPGLIISFDDGLRSQAEVAGPLLEKYGFTGWFFVPLGFVETPDDQQANFARAHRIQYADEYDDGRAAMSLEEMQRLSRRHVIGCHTDSHYRCGVHSAASELHTEIKGAKQRMEKALECGVPVFCWVGGEEDAYTSEVATLISRAGFGTVL